MSPASQADHQPDGAPPAVYFQKLKENQEVEDELKSQLRQLEEELVSRLSVSLSLCVCFTICRYLFSLIRSFFWGGGGPALNFKILT